MNLFSNLLFGSSFASQLALAQTTEVVTTAVAQPAPPAWMQFVPFIVIISVFYFFLIRPQAKKQKETQSFLVGLKVGDQIITQAGILGRIAGLTDKLATLEIANNVQIKVLRTQILTSQALLQDKKEGN